jgi:hypothetical protein
MFIEKRHLKSSKMTFYRSEMKNDNQTLTVTPTATWSNNKPKPVNMKLIYTGNDEKKQEILNNCLLENENRHHERPFSYTSGRSSSLITSDTLFKVCFKCNECIADAENGLKAADGLYHENCLVCSECGRPMLVIFSQR